jgi:cyanate lyase
MALFATSWSRAFRPLAARQALVRQSVSACSSSSATTPIGCYRYYTSVKETALAERVHRVLTTKLESGLSYDALADKLGVTNTYCAHLLLGQAKLTPETAIKLKAALPSISELDLQAMQYEFPMRTFDDNLIKEPNVYRTYEAIMHNGEAIKAIINEKCGDGIMSAIDFYLDVGTTTGKHGEKRVVITFNGKFLPFCEQKAEDNGARSPRD